MAYFPFYIDIRNKVWLIIGGGRIAWHKIEILSEFNADMIVIAPEICDAIYKMEEVIHNKSNGCKINLKKREFIDEDLLEADYVIAATDDANLNSHISELCGSHQKLVNVVDVKEECSFIFPAIVKQEELVIAVSTGGHSPAMAAKIKRDIETTIPDYYGDLIEALGDYRDTIKDEIKDSRKRKQVYQELIAEASELKRNLMKDEIELIISKYK